MRLEILLALVERVKDRLPAGFDVVFVEVDGVGVDLVGQILDVFATSELTFGCLPCTEDLKPVNPLDSIPNHRRELAPRPGRMI
jgi:hypothetical protein